MGLSSSSTKTDSKTSQNTNQTETGTTTPITPDFLTQAAGDYVGRIGSFGGMDPNSFVAPSSPLQNMAWNNASSLGDWRQQTATASQMAQNAGNAGPHFAGQMGGQQMQGNPLNAMAKHTGQMPLPVGEQGGAPMSAFSGAQQGGPAYTYNAPNVGNVAAPNAYRASPTSLGGAPQTSGQGYNSPQLHNPGLVSGQGYSAPQLGQAGGYAAARTGSPIGAQAYGYNPTSINSSQIAQTPGATASTATAGNIGGNISQFQNPYQSQVIDASLADFDHNAQVQQAQQEAQGARNGAFGGSRFGIAQGALLGDQGRSRATLDAGLRDQGFNAATALAGQQAGYDQGTSLFNAQNQTGVSLANSAQDYSRAAGDAGFVQQANLANQGAMDQASQFTSGAANASQLQYAGAANQYGLDQAGRQDTASQFGLGQQQQRDLTQAGFQDTAARYGADSGMQAALANQNMQGQYGLAQGQLDANAGQFGAASANQAGLANQNMQGQYGLAQFGNDAQTAANYAQAQNASGLAGYQGNLQQSQLQAQLAAQAGQYNAGANNQMSQFNAGQGDNAANRSLQAAGMLGGLANDYGAGTRADLGTMSAMGDQQRQIEQAYSMAGPAQLQLMGQLSGMTPYDILVGRQVNGNTTGQMTGTGQSNTVQSPSLFSQLLQAGSTAAAFM